MPSSRPSVEDLFASMAAQKVLVMGDVMVDAYWWGDVNRISPEAPVPVVSVRHKEYRLGGAGNVARNIRAMGAEALVVAVVGNDEGGRQCRQLFREQGLDDSGLVTSEGRKTTLKSRVIAHRHQMLRVDEESVHDLSAEEETRLWSAARAHLEQGRVNAVILEDYDKGGLSAALIARVTELCARLKIPVAVDPKRKNFSVYRGVTLFKPNLRELAEGMALELDGRDLPVLQNAMAAFRKSREHDILMVTLAELGVAVDDQNGFYHVPAVRRDIADVSGAGDSVITVATLALTAGLPSRDAAALANLAGGLVCESLGVVTVPLDRLHGEAAKYFSKGE